MIPAKTSADGTKLGELILRLQPSGFWLQPSARPEADGSRARSPKPEVRSLKPEVRSLNFQRAKKRKPLAAIADDRGLHVEEGALLLERDLLDAPVDHLADQQLVLAAAVERVREAELLHLVTRRPEPADHLAVERHLVDRRVFHPVLVAGVRDVEILRRARRHAHRNRASDAGELRLEVAVAVEDLHALVAGIEHVDVSLRVDGQRLRSVELAVL